MCVYTYICVCIYLYILSGKEKFEIKKMVSFTMFFPPLCCNLIIFKENVYE